MSTIKSIVVKTIPIIIACWLLAVIDDGKLVTVYLSGDKEWGIIASYSPDPWSWGNLLL